jgi:hypothetical protein
MVVIRKSITKKELQDWLTAEIKKNDGCETCEFRGIMGLQEPDEEGCNWSDTLYLNQSGISNSIIQSVVRSAREKFNISD